MRRARDPDRPVPWMKRTDPHDLEASYRRPVKRSDVERLVVKGAVIVAAFLWFRGAVFADTDLAGLAFAVGAVLTVSGVVDLFAAVRGDLEEIFLTRSQQVVTRTLMFLAGIALVGFAVVRDVL
jgi:hypothetical protein